MAGGSEIRRKIQSIKKTQKITSAMRMVAASKMRKTQERMRASKAYATNIRRVIKHIARATSEYHHAFMEARDLKNVGVIVVSSDRGLCGGLNANMFRELTKQVKSWRDASIQVSFCNVGRKGMSFLKRTGGNVLASIENLGDTPSIQSIVGAAKTMIDAYYAGELDGLYVIYNEFVNTMTQKPTLKQLLPLPVDTSEESTLGHHWDYIYEPDAKELLDEVMTRYIELQMYQSVVENIACEQAAKMIAMKNATDNAGELIKEFQLAYNKARQAAITQELAEIVGGADAL
jgi:F-type H+-transporting ATPase subunit gamma